jgi:O-antigen/teichoic acid export membrane protein
VSSQEREAAVSDGFRPAALELNVVAAAKGMAITFAGKLLGIPQRIVLGVLLARFLGAEQYGLYNLALSAAAIAGTFAILGLDTGLVRYVSAFASRRDTASLSGALRVGVGIPLLFSSLFGLTLIVWAGQIAEGWFHEPRLVPLLRWVGLVVPFIALNEVLAAATRGFKNQHYSVIARYVCQPLVKIGALALLAIVGLNAELAVGAFIAAEMATCVLFVYFLNRQFPLRQIAGAARLNLREILSFSVAVYLSQAVKSVTLNIQALVLAASSTVAAVGIYAVADQASMMSRLVMQSVTTVSMPFMSELHEQRNTRQLEVFYQITSKWTFTLNLPLFLVIVALPETILSVFGETFLDGVQALIILAWASLLMAATGTNSVVLDMSGHTRLKFANSLVTAVVTIGLNLLLVPSMGVVGAAWAALSGVVVVEVLRLLEVWAILRISPYNLGFLKPVSAGLAAVASLYAVGQAFPGLDPLARLVVYCAAIFGPYVAVILLLGLSNEDRLLLSRLRRRAKLG